MRATTRRSRAAFTGIDVVASLAGPFLELGLGPVQAAVDAGAHYLDTSGEQQWVGLVHAEIQAETVVLPAFGFDYVPGDLAARLAAEKVEGPLDEIVVAYSVEGRRNEQGDAALDRARDGSEAGGVAGRPARPVARSARRRARFASRSASGPSSSGAATEPLTVPRHTDVRNVRSYIRAPGDRREGRRPRAASRRRSSALPRGVGPPGPVGGVPAEEPLHGRRRGARPRGNRSRGCRRAPTSTG